MFVFIRYELNIVYTDDKKIITLFVIFMSIKKKNGESKLLNTGGDSSSFICISLR